MSLSKKTKLELIAEVKQLRREVASVKKVGEPIKGKIDFGHTNLMSFLEHSSNHILIVDAKGIILDINKTTADLKKEDTIGVSSYLFVDKDYQGILKNAISSVFKSKTPQSYKSKRVVPDVGTFYYNSTITPIISNQKVIAAIIDAQDITAEVTSKNDLKISEEKFRRLAQNAHDIVYRYSFVPEPKHEYMSPSVLAITGYTVEEFYKDPNLGFKLIHPDDLHIVQALKADPNTFSSAKSKNIKPRVLRWIRKDGKVIWTETIDTPIFDDAGNVIAVEGISRDITERKRTEMFNKEETQNLILSQHAELVPGVIFQYRVYPDGRDTFPYASKKMLEIFEIDPEEVIVDASKAWSRTYGPDVKELEDTIKISMDTLNDWDHEYRVELPKKGIRWLHGHAKPDKLEDGSFVLYGYISDNTERRLIVEQMNDSLQEKEVLLKEVHHRVKNNLQVISSILNLQSSYVKNKAILNVLQESQNRIKSMAFIHESLYQADDFSSINFSDYIVNLLQNLTHSYSKLNQTVKLNVDLQDILLNLDLAIPCGLIINEIVSNSLKYAFAENGKNDELTISMKKKGGNITLVAADNGVGLPAGIDYKNTESLGLQLVVTLVDQLDGTIKMDNTNGASYTIKFNSKD